VKGVTKIPPSFLTNDRYQFDYKGVLWDTRLDEPKLANPQLAGQPRYWVVNFQDIWNGNMAKQSRAARVDKLKDILRPYIEKVKPIKKFPIEVAIVIYDVSMATDISNRGAIYTKVIEDLLVSEGVIPDDKVQYINCSGSCRYVQVSRIEEKRMEVLIFSGDI
jgi:hypothetical protein